jgi:hypothetical protein
MFTYIYQTLSGLLSGKHPVQISAGLRTTLIRFDIGDCQFRNVSLFVILLPMERIVLFICSGITRSSPERNTTQIPLEYRRNIESAILFGHAQS